jgi:hypothetical protein
VNGTGRPSGRPVFCGWSDKRKTIPAGRVFGIGRVACEVEGAETLDRDDLALGKEPADRVDAIEQ